MVKLTGNCFNLYQYYIEENIKVICDEYEDQSTEQNNVNGENILSDPKQFFIGVLEADKIYK